MSIYPMFPVKPRSDGMIETVEWQTNVIQAHDGTEQRIKLREVPRKSVNLSYDATRWDVSLLDAALFKNVFKHSDPDTLLRYTIPYWWDLQKLTVAVGVGAIDVTGIVTTGYAFAVAGLAVLIKASLLYDRERALLAPDDAALAVSDDWEVITLDGVNATDVTINGATTGAFAIGDYILPAMQGYMTGTTGMDDQTDAGETFRIRSSFALEPVAE